MQDILQVEWKKEGGSGGAQEDHKSSDEIDRKLSVLEHL